MTSEERIARILLTIGAVTLSPEKPYKLASGILSPIYCDNRLIMSYPHERQTVVQAMKDEIEKSKMQVDVIAGTATSAIPYAAWIAHELKLPLIYIRKKTKGYGTEKLVEGVLKSGQKVIVIEDLITSGGSALNSVLAVRDAGGIVNNVLAIFTYGTKKSVQGFSESMCNLHTLTNFHVLIPIAAQEGKISENEVASVLAWAENPEAWSKEHSPYQ